MEHSIPQTGKRPTTLAVTALTLWRDSVRGRYLRNNQSRCLGTTEVGERHDMAFGIRQGAHILTKESVEASKGLYHNDHDCLQKTLASAPVRRGQRAPSSSV